MAEGPAPKGHGNIERDCIVKNLLADMLESIGDGCMYLVWLIDPSEARFQMWLNKNRRK